jgi:hypothetical protein
MIYNCLTTRRMSRRRDTRQTRERQNGTAGRPRPLRDLLGRDAGKLARPVWRTRQGLADFAIVWSYLATAAKWDVPKIDALRGIFKGNPWIRYDDAPRKWFSVNFVVAQ